MTREQHHHRKQKRLARRQYLRAAAIGTLGFCTAYAVDEEGKRPEWVEIVRTDLVLPGLPQGFEGARLIQASDLHCSATVSEEYLRRCIQRINRLHPDLIVLTGDYVTYDRAGRYQRKIVELLGRLRARLGVFASLGNHDYTRPALLQYLSEGMAAQGIQVLRNSICTVESGKDRIQIVGLGDLWSEDFHPRKAFEGASRGVPTLALSHNPDTMESLRHFSPDVVLSGHTHGSRGRLRLLAPIRNRQYYAGLFQVGTKQLYVNRGLGRLGRIRWNCPPEITVFTLCSKPAAPAKIAQ